MNVKSKSLTVLIAALVSTFAWAELPHITDVRVNPTPPGAKVSAAYLNMHNPGNDELEILNISSPAIARVEIHKTEVVDDVARMRKQESVVLAADEHVAFKHGGLHIMLMGLESPMIPGNKIPLVFHTNQGDITINAQVAETIALPGDSKHADMNHDDMDHGTLDHSQMKHEEFDATKNSKQDH